MKKLLTALLAAVLCLTGCGGGETTYSTDELKDFVVKSGEISTWNYLDQAATSSTQVLVNLVSGLLETDKYGKIVGDCAAEGWTVNENADVWTFKLKDGLKWYKKVLDDEGNSTYEEYADITAHDFVYGIKWVLENSTACYELACSTIKGAKEYQTGATTDFSTVGVKALDDKTVEFTLIGATPYFDTVVLYPSFYPASQKFVEECGENWATSPETILYNSAYFVDAFTAEQEKVFVKNENYWDADSVTIPKVTVLAVDSYESTYNLFKEGYLSHCRLAGTQPMKLYEDGDEHMFRTDPYACNYVFFLNNRTNVKDAEEKGTTRENTQKAINNLNFRKALFYGIDREGFVEQTDPIDPKSIYAYTYTADGYVSTTDGTDYTDQPELKQFKQDQYDSAKAQDYLAKAKQELGDTVTWPVHIQWWHKAGNETAENTAAVLKDTIDTEFDGDIVLDIEEYTTSMLVDVYPDEYQCLSAAGWIPDYGDPSNVLYTFLPDGYMNNVKNNALSHWDLPQEYIDMYNDAFATADIDARYKKFAECEQYLIENCYIIPMYQAGAYYKLTTFNEYSRIYSLTGGVNFRYKGIELRDHVLTAEEVAADKDAWHKKRVELGLAK